MSVRGDIWSEERLDEYRGTRTTPNLVDDDPPGWRSRFQQDHDRLLFSTPVRRLSDKTQVWPMDENDGVRTRLTHSHEVANLARSIGSRIQSEKPDAFGGADLHRTVQPILSAIGLAHDLGNTPFGHQGETAISAWFDRRKNWIFHRQTSDGVGLDHPVVDSVRDDFLAFDGNPQTLRLVTKLQTSVNDVGLNLTAATLAALVKYPINAALRDSSQPTRKKVGYFESESEILSWIRDATGLGVGERHPLTWIMEACDDIAYSVLDVDDIMKKGIISPDDVRAILEGDRHVSKHAVVTQIAQKFGGIDASGRRAEVVRDIKIGYLRAILIERLILDATSAFLSGYDTIFQRDHTVPLMKKHELCDVLKGVARQYAFSNQGVLRMEAVGASAIDDLMCFFWSAIADGFDEKGELQPKTARGRFALSLISPNYIEDAVRSLGRDGPSGVARYVELRLLTDMVSGMTDTFAIKLAENVRLVPDVSSS